MFDYKGQWFPMVSPANELGSFESSHFPLRWQHLIIIVFWLLPSFCIADLEENPFYLNTWYLKDKGCTYIHYIHICIYTCPHIITDTRMYSVCVCNIHISLHIMIFILGIGELDDLSPCTSQKSNYGAPKPSSTTGWGRSGAPSWAVFIGNASDPRRFFS